jgi:hypothetical protein
LSLSLDLESHRQRSSLTTEIFVELKRQTELHIEQLGELSFSVRCEASNANGNPSHVETPMVPAEAVPEAVQRLITAVGGNLSASLLICLRKILTTYSDTHADVRVPTTEQDGAPQLPRKIEVVLHVSLPTDSLDLYRRLKPLEDFSAVTQSLRDGVEIEVEVRAHEATPVR